MQAASLWVTARTWHPTPKLTSHIKAREKWRAVEDVLCHRKLQNLRETGQDLANVWGRSKSIDVWLL